MRTPTKGTPDFSETAIYCPPAPGSPARFTPKFGASRRSLGSSCGSGRTCCCTGTAWHRQESGRGPLKGVLGIPLKGVGGSCWG